jgi:hypothetical protein
MPYPNKELEFAHRVWNKNPALEAYREEKKGILYLFEERGKILGIPTDWLFGYSTAITGMTGSGKTQTIKRVCYELYQDTGLNMTFFDPDGDYFVFKDLFPDWQIVGYRKKLNPDEAREIWQNALISNQPTIISMLDTDIIGRVKFLINYMNAQWASAEKERSAHSTMPHLNIIEEAKFFLPVRLPEGEKKEYAELAVLIERVATRGRKFGIGQIIGTQRPQEINQKSMTQCDNLFLHRVSNPLDINRYHEWLGFPDSEIQKVMDKLGKGMCIFSTPYNKDGKIHPFQVRKLNQLIDASQTSKPEDVGKLEQKYRGVRNDESDSLLQPKDNGKA